MLPYNNLTVPLNTFLQPLNGLNFMTTETEQETQDMNSKETNIDTATFGDSTILLRADFDPFLSTLKLYFRGDGDAAGGVYIYVDVKRTIFNQLRDAESAGKFFVKNIKDVFENMKLA